MINKYQLNENYIKKSIKKGISLLKGTNTKASQRNDVMQDIYFFKQLLNNNINNQIKDENNKYSLDKLKHITLAKMKQQLKILSPNLIDWLIFLNQEKIFDKQYFYDKTELSIEKQEELTIKNYEQNSKILLKYAKEIFSPIPTQQIQLCYDDFDCSSYCHYSNINEIPFIIVNPLDAPHILNHEIQHGIEFLLKLNTHDIYSELGPIFYEILFTNVLYSSQGFIMYGDFHERIEDACFQLESVTEYLKVLKKIYSCDFTLTTAEFKEIVIQTLEIPKKLLYQYLIDEVINDGFDNTITYLLSYLKAIELYKNSKIHNSDSFETLNPYLSTNQFTFNIPENASQLYTSYIEEMKQKVKNK